MAPCITFFYLLFLAAVRTSSASITGEVILTYRTPSAWFGSSAIALLGPSDPVLMASTWVFPPQEVLGFRPSRNATAPAWRDDTTKDLQYQTLTVSAPGAAPAAAPGRVDALAFWNRKPHGLDGTCVLVGFHSAAAPDLSLRPPPFAPGSWHYNLSADCGNVNLAVPWSRFALSSDGATAVAWVQASSGSLTIFALEGQSGALRWRKEVPCGSTPAACQYFLAYGADVSENGKFIVFDEGQAGEGGGGHRLHVLNAADGTPRCAPLLSPGAIPAHLSPNGDFAFSSMDSGSAGAPPTGEFATWRWEEASGAYVRLPGLGRPPLPDPAGHGWVLAQYAFAYTGSSTLVGVVWYDATLLGPSVAALYNASAVGSGALSAAHTEALPGSQLANSGAVIDCAGEVCAAGFYTQRVGGPQPTVVVLGVGGQSFNFTTPGSVDAISIATHPGAPGEYYVLATGCASVGVCTVPGGDLVVLRISVV